MNHDSLISYQLWFFPYCWYFIASLDSFFCLFSGIESIWTTLLLCYNATVLILRTHGYSLSCCLPITWQLRWAIIYTIFYLSLTSTLVFYPLIDVTCIDSLFFYRACILFTVTISFLSHVFFLVTIVWYPYFPFAPLHEETNHYLLAFPSYSSSFIIPL